jgi:hypothetical protein
MGDVQADSPKVLKKAELHVAVEDVSDLTKGVKMKKLVCIGALALFSSQSFGGLFGSAIGGAVGGAIGKTVGTAAASPSMEKSLTEAAGKLNMQFPKMIDSDTRIDRVSAGPGLLFTYHHTFINSTVRDVDMNLFNVTFSNDLRMKVCANSDMRPMFKSGVTAVYTYQSREGKTIGSVNVTPKQCGI